jgi:hypothetical protein
MIIGEKDFFKKFIQDKKVIEFLEGKYTPELFIENMK